MLGDTVQRSLETVGVTKEKVERWLGHTCQGCQERKTRLNMIHAWANRIAMDRTKNAIEYLQQMLGEEW